MTIIQIAELCHEANRTYCHLNGDDSQKPWAEAEQWQRDSAVKGVQFALANPDAPASSQHDAWTADKVAHGWTYGPEKDADLKTHPYLVPYAELPVFQRMKDSLFQSVVNCFRDLAETA